MAQMLSIEEKNRNKKNNQSRNRLATMGTPLNDELSDLETLSTHKNANDKVNSSADSSTSSVFQPEPLPQIELSHNSALFPNSAQTTPNRVTSSNGGTPHALSNNLHNLNALTPVQLNLSKRHDATASHSTPQSNLARHTFTTFSPDAQSVLQSQQTPASQACTSKHSVGNLFPLHNVKFDQNAPVV